MMHDDATLRQIRAAHPRRSTWLTANAGSGKTRVLTDRVARLLLDGVDPQHILCLTYTKAAAGEMQNRLFRTLGAWSMLDDDALTQELRGKGIDGALDLDQARRLFARAIETPGGLKIQTIHSFCSGLLRRFPMEADVSPQFQEVDDRTAQLIRLEVLDDMAMPEDADHPAFRALAARHTSSIEDLAREVMSHAPRFAAPMPENAVRKAIGAPVDDPLAQLAGIDDVLRPLVEALKSGSANDAKARDKLLPLLGQPVTPSLFHVLCDVFLTKSGKAPFTVSTRFPTKAVRTAHPDVMEEVEDAALLVETLRQPVLAWQAMERTRVLYDFATCFVPRVQAAFHARGFLGFDDLIARARGLLSTPEVAQWVLWRLDGGIDHILVDEAQDTSPDQWAVVQLLSQELAAGQGAHSERTRTVFVVGDRKQSIYSFQGADPDEFDRMQRYFHERLKDSEQPLAVMSLDHSFRSSPAVLGLVDRVFTGEASEGLEDQVTHLAFKDGMPGRVDLWPQLDPVDPPPRPEDWAAPIDQISPQDPKLRLAQQIARRIRHMVDHETIPVEQDGAWHRRPITEGDILILVRRRKELFAAILRECKKLGLRVAGADRLRLGGELAVKDITALLQFLALPEDDLSLAVALRSPLFGWSEADLFDLAHGRQGYLWQALRQRDDHEETRSILQDLRDRADYLRPFELISRILTRHNGRQRILERLGAEAEEGVDALLSQALVYESAQVPSLTGFLVWLEAEDVEVKRQLDSGAGALRVMTVHGAKGLEAPIVILPDTSKRKPPGAKPVMTDGDIALWPPVKPEMPDAMLDLLDAAQMREASEARRLLYVAMTRAESWLMVAAAGDVGEGLDSWYTMIDGAMTDASELAAPDGDPIRRIQHGAWDALPSLTLPESQQGSAQPMAFAPLPEWPEVVGMLSPSDLGGAKVLPGDTGGGDKEAAMARGTLLHQMLEHLPKLAPPARLQVAMRMLEDDDLNADLPELAISLLDDPALAPYFADGMAEVDITADLPALGGRRILGAIDLLVVRGEEVIAIDFKTNRVTPNSPEHVPEGLLRQMGAYGAALHQMWPEKTVRTAILWTHCKNLMFLPRELTDAALVRAGAS